jgi:ribosomal-protein-alanine N-acetyltransferase
MELIVERMRETDLARVVEIEEASGLTTRGVDGYRRGLKDDQTVLLVARGGEEGSPCVVIGSFSGRIVEGELQVEDLAVLIEQRGRGIGRALMRRAIGEARSRGAAWATLEVRAGNEVARRLYERVGFRVVGRRRDYYRAPLDDALIMKCEGREWESEAA